MVDSKIVAGIGNHVIATAVTIVYRQTGEDVGSYDVTLGSGSKAANYNISFSADNNALTIDKRAITLAADAVSKTYGDADPTLTAHVSGGSLGSVTVSDTVADVTGSLTRQTGENVGSYDVALGSGSKASNYDISFSTDNNALTIGKRAITLTADAVSKTYGAADPALTAHVSNGSLGSVTVSDALADVTGSLSRQAGENVGSYDVILGNGSKAANYIISFVVDNNALSIGAKALALAGSTGVTKVYDGTTNMPGGNLGYGSLTGIVGSDNVVVDGSAVFDSANAGARSIKQGSIALGGAAAGNYTLNWTDGSGSISKASLTVRANNDAKFVTKSDVAGYGGVSYSGWVNGETSAAIDATGLQISRSNSGTETAAIYNGVLTASGLVANNYDFTYVKEPLKNCRF